MQCYLSDCHTTQEKAHYCLLHFDRLVIFFDPPASVQNLWRRRNFTANMIVLPILLVCCQFYVGPSFASSKWTIDSNNGFCVVPPWPATLWVIVIGHSPGHWGKTTGTGMECWQRQEIFGRNPISFEVTMDGAYRNWISCGCGRPVGVCFWRPDATLTKDLGNYERWRQILHCRRWLWVLCVGGVAGGFDIRRVAHMGFLHWFQFMIHSVAVVSLLCLAFRLSIQYRVWIVN